MSLHFPIRYSCDPDKFPAASAKAASSESIKIANRLNESMQRPPSAFFSELLVISRLEGNALPRNTVNIGAMYISVHDNPASGTHQISHMAQWAIDAEQIIRITRTNTILTPDKGLLAEEQTNEFHLNRAKHVRQVYLRPHPHTPPPSFQTRYTRRTDDGLLIDQLRSHRISRDREFLSQGSVWWVKRQWAISGFTGTIDAQTINETGQLVSMRFVCIPRKSFSWCGKMVDAVEIQQYWLLPHTKVEISKAIYLTSGHLLCMYFQSRQQQLVAHLMEHVGVPPLDFGVHLSGKDGLAWLQSYIAAKRQKKQELERIFAEDQDAFNLLADYLTLLLINKPPDVLSYSKKYFTAFLDE